MSQLILQPFRRFTYVTAPTLPLLQLSHSSFSNSSVASPTSQALHLIHLASLPCPVLFSKFSIEFDSLYTFKGQENCSLHVFLLQVGSGAAVFNVLGMCNSEKLIGLITVKQFTREDKGIILYKPTYCTCAENGTVIYRRSTKSTKVLKGSS